MAAAGIVGALAIPAMGGRSLGYRGAAVALPALVISELAALPINDANRSTHGKELAAA